MRAGSLRHNITVQVATNTQDSMGSVTRTWATFKAVRASIQPIRGNESIAASQIVAEATHMIQIRYLAGLLPSMRILYGARIFQIKSAADVYMGHRMMELLCEEVT